MAKMISFQTTLRSIEDDNPNSLLAAFRLTKRVGYANYNDMLADTIWVQKLAYGVEAELRDILCDDQIAIAFEI